MSFDIFSPVDTKGNAEGPPSSDDGKWYNRVRLLCASLIGATVTYLGVCIAALLVYSVVFPPITGVQLQHSLESAVRGSDPRRVYVPIQLSQMHPSLPRAVVGGEDSRFFRHHGIDWQAVDDALEEYRKGQRLRGGSSITQQLVKNLFMTTHRTVLRKALEVPLAYAADLLLSKRRILELYINVIEWAPGVYGAEAASQYYYGVSAADLTFRRSAALAACIPDPRDRHPGNVSRYQHIILRRMRNLGPLPLPLDDYEPRSRPSAPATDVPETNQTNKSVPPDSQRDTTMVDRSSPPDSLASPDSVPAAESLPSTDSVPEPSRVPTENDTPQINRARPEPPDSHGQEETVAPDTSDTP